MKPRFRSFLFLAGSSLLTISSASAATYDWNKTAAATNYTWNTGANWTTIETDPLFPNSVGAIANLNNDIAGAQTIALNAAITLGTLNFGDSGGTPFAITLNAGTGGSLIFDNTGSSDALLTRGSGLASVREYINANITLNDNLVINNTSTGGSTANALELTGQITGNKGITLQGPGWTGILNAANNNNYTGGLTLDGGTVMTRNYSNVFGTGALTITSLGGTVSTGAQGAAAQLLVTTNTNVWNGNLTVSGAMWNNNGNVTLGNNVTVTSGGDLYLGLGGNIGETGGPRSLTLSSGAGGPALRTPFIFSGTNTYTGGTTVNGGIATFMKTASMPTTGNISFATGTTALGIAVGGAGEWTTTGTGAGTLNGIFNGLGAGGATLTYGSAVSLNLIVTGNQSYGAITNLGSGNNNFTKSGIGTLTITGDNTFGGQTLLLGGGGYTLDYASSNTSKFGSGVVFFGHAPAGTQPHQGYGGGTVTLKGGSTTDVFGTFNLNAGGTFIVRESGGTSKLRFNAMNGRNTGGTISFGDALIADIDRLNVNGILGGWATLGDDWAINSTNGADGAVTALALAAYNGALATSGGVATQNNTLAGSQIQAGTTVANTVKITNTGNSQTLDLVGNTLTITSATHAAAATPGGIMYAGGSDNLYSITGTSAARISSSTANSELIFAVQRGTLSLGVAINGNSPVTKSGAGTLAISATNTGSGAMYVNQGVVRLESAAASGAAATFGGTGIYVQNNAALELTGGFSFPLDERIMITGSGVSDGGALRSVSGANTWRSLVDIGIGGARINNDDAANAFTLANGSAYAAGVATVAGGDVTFGGVGNTIVSATAGIYGAGGVIKDGNGTLTLSAANTYIGATTVNNGKLVVNGNISTSLFTTVKNGATLGGTGTTGALVIENGGTLAPGNSPGTLNTGTLTLNSTSISAFELNPGDVTVGLGINDLVSVTGNLTLDGVLNVTATSGDFLSVAVNTAWRLFNYTGTLTNNTLSLGSMPTLGSGKNWSINTSTLGQVNLVVVPEPRAALLGGIGMLLLLRRRRQ